MRRTISFKGRVEIFPSFGGWHYIEVPKKYTNDLREQRKAWGMYPITVDLGNTSWETKLMMKKGGDFFIALKSAIRIKEKITVGDKISISFSLE